LTKIDISKNKIRAEGGKALAAGLKGNQVIIELNIADNQLSWDAAVDNDMSGIIALANVIPGMWALSKLDVRSNNIPSAGRALLKAACDTKGVSLAL
jgi:hypothetical protein